MLCCKAYSQVCFKESTSYRSLNNKSSTSCSMERESSLRRPLYRYSRKMRNRNGLVSWIIIFLEAKTSNVESFVEWEMKSAHWYFTGFDIVSARLIKANREIQRNRNIENTIYEGLCPFRWITFLQMNKLSVMSCSLFLDIYKPELIFGNYEVSGQGENNHSRLATTK